MTCYPELELIGIGVAAILLGMLAARTMAVLGLMP